MKFNTKAEQTAHGLIQSYIGPDHKVIDMRSFYSVLMQELERAHEEGLKRRADPTRDNPKTARCDGPSLVVGRVDR
jgi:hypothetical protein